MLIRFSAASVSPVKIGPRIAVFREYKGLNIKYSHHDPQKDFLTRNDVFWRIVRTNSFKGLGYSLIEEPKTTNVKTSHIKRHGKITYLEAETPEPIATRPMAYTTACTTV